MSCILISEIMENVELYNLRNNYLCSDFVILFSVAEYKKKLIDKKIKELNKQK